MIGGNILAFRLVQANIFYALLFLIYLYLSMCRFLYVYSLSVVVSNRIHNVLIAFFQAVLRYENDDFKWRHLFLLYILYNTIIVSLSAVFRFASYIFSNWVFVTTH